MNIQPFGEAEHGTIPPQCLLQSSDCLHALFILSFFSILFSCWICFFVRLLKSSPLLIYLFYSKHMQNFNKFFLWTRVSSWRGKKECLISEQLWTTEIFHSSIHLHGEHRESHSRLENWLIGSCSGKPSAFFSGYDGRALLDASRFSGPARSPAAHVI